MGGDIASTEKIIEKIRESLLMMKTGKQCGQEEGKGIEVMQRSRKLEDLIRQDISGLFFLVRSVIF